MKKFLVILMGLLIVVGGVFIALVMIFAGASLITLGTYVYVE